MANATKLFPLSAITFTQLARPDAPKPRLSQAISASGTTLRFLNPLLGSDGLTITEAMFIGVRNEDSYVETVLIPTGSLAYDAQSANFTVGSVLTGGTSGAKAIIVRDSDSGTTGTLTLVVYSGTFQDNETITDAAGGSATVNGTLTAAISADGKTATGCVRGIDLDGLDWTVGDSTLATSHKAGDAVFCNISGVIAALWTAAIQGTIATGSAGFTIGTEPGAAGETTTLYRTTTAGVKLGFFRWSANFSQFSNDGTTWVNCSDVSASDLQKVSANDTTGGYLNGKAVAGDGISLTEVNDGGNETLRWAVVASDLVSGDFGLEVSGNDFRIRLATDSGLQFNTGLEAKLDPVGGLTKGPNGMGLSGAFYPAISLTAAEAITANDAVALLPIEVEFFDQLTSANLALGDSNIRRRHAIRIVPSVTTSSLTTMLFRAAEAVNGATTLGNLTISIQTDSAGAPSGTVITNGTANVISQATQRTWNTTQANRTATWATPPTLTAGTVYWIVFEVAATDATNYLNFGVNSSHDENYITFTRLTYNLDTATWGTSTTNATPFFWFNNQPKLLGMGLVPTDANWAARTWNFIGFAASTVAAGATVNVYHDTAPYSATLTPNKPYYLSETPGQITTTAPSAIYLSGTEPSSFTYRVARSTGTSALKIDKGNKRVMIHESSGFTATTTRQYVLWFKPEIVRTTGVATDGGEFGYSSGYVSAGAEDGSIGVGTNAGGAETISNSVTASVAAGDSTLTDAITGAGSNFTDAGFTYTYTESGTVTGSHFILEALA